MPRRRPAPPPDPARVSRALGAAPARSRPGWVPGPPGRAHPQGPPSAQVQVVDEVARLDADLRAARRPGILTVPESIRRGRVAVSQTAVVAAIALAVALGAAFAVRALWAERAATVSGTAAASTSPTVLVTSAVASGAWPSAGAAAPAADPAVRSVPGAGGADAAAPPVPAEIVVHVAGRVRRPGVVTLPAGSRVVDAVTRAGGAAGDADLAALNLARVLADGEQVYVPRPGEVPPSPPVGGAAPAPGGAPASGAGALVDLNTADATTLETLPGVGPVLAGRIVEWREANGRFTSVDELTDVSGIGEKLFAQLRPRVTV